MNDIPKKIHYCWFGENQLPDLAIKCIDSWKRFFPGYEIIEWNESNFNIDSCTYVREAYDAKKWAFVSDYARFKILYENGGVYFDTDVEVIKSMDEILKKGPFMGLEKMGNVSVAPGLGMAANPGLGMAANPGLGIYREILDFYSQKHFLNDDGSLDTTTVVVYVTEVLKKHGLKSTSDIQEIEGIYIYPKEYFCPMDYNTGILNITKNTYSIHHFTASWHTDEEKYAYTLQKSFCSVLPVKLASFFAICIATIKFRGSIALCKRISGKLARIFSV